MGVEAYARPRRGNWFETLVPNQMKGVILFATRGRRLALAVLAGVLFGLFGTAVANADAQAATPAPTTAQAGTQMHVVHPDLLDWWD